MKLGLEVRVAVITGGIKGIGRAIARGLTAEGGSQIVIDGVLSVNPRQA